MSVRPSRMIFSCCPAGRNCWFWVLFPESGGWYENPPYASGWADTAEEAEEHARKAAGADLWLRSNGIAHDVRVRLRAERRMHSAPTDNGQSTRLEFVYCLVNCEVSGRSLSHFLFRKYQIVKRTPKRVFVNRDEYRENSSQQEPSWRDYDTHSFILDRAALESGEGAPSKYSSVFPNPLNQRVFWYFNSEEEAIQKLCANSQTQHAREKYSRTAHTCPVLGIDLPCTVEEVKSAYRELAKVHHPDVGGDPAEFAKIERAYREALRQCKL